MHQGQFAIYMPKSDADISRKHKRIVRGTTHNSDPIIVTANIYFPLTNFGSR